MNVQETLTQPPRPPVVKPNEGGSKTITMAMIAKAAGVSQGAISSLLNDRDYGIRVSPKTREHVFRVCREMGYIPNDLRAVVRMYPAKGQLCLFIDSSLRQTVPPSSLLIPALLKEAGTQPLALSYFHPASSTAPEILNFGVASKFIILGTPTPNLFTLLAEREAPIVQIGQEASYPGVTSLIPDYVGAARKAIQTLLSLGHQRIAVLSGPFATQSPHLMALNHGIRTAFEEANLPIGAQDILYGDETPEHGRASLDLLWEREDRLTALFTYGEPIAAGVLQRAAERGIRIPADLSLITFGYSPTGITCPATTVAIPVVEIATQALNDIQNRLLDQDYQSTRHVPIAFEFVEQNTCAPPPNR